MSIIKSSNEHLTLNADGSGKDIKFQSNGSEVASISDGGVVTATTFTGAATDATKLPLAGGTITGNIVGGDNIKLQLGDNNGSPCLEIFHDNSNSYVKDVGPGSLILNTDGNNIQITSGSSEVMAQFNKDGASDLYHNGTKRLFTLDNGSETNGTHNAHNVIVAENGKLEVKTPNDSGTHLVQRMGSTAGAYGYVDFEVVTPNSTSANLPRFDMQVANATIMSLCRGGRVGIATTSPSETFTIADPSSKGWSVNIENNTCNIRSRASAADTQNTRLFYEY